MKRCPCGCNLPNPTVCPACGGPAFWDFVRIGGEPTRRSALYCHDPQCGQVLVKPDNVNTDVMNEYLRLQRRAREAEATAWEYEKQVVERLGNDGTGQIPHDLRRQLSETLAFWQSALDDLIGFKLVHPELRDIVERSGV